MNVRALFLPLLALLVAAAAPAWAADTSGESAHPDTTAHLTFSTSLVATGPSAGADEGTLIISVDSRGSVLGYFRAAGSFALQDVIGTLSGDQLWLDIGDQRPLHIEGTYRDGTIVGYTLLPAPFGHGFEPYRFTATPVSSRT